MYPDDPANGEKPPEAKPQVEVFKRINRLKLKVGGSLEGGPGQFDPKLLEQAHTLVANRSTQYQSQTVLDIESLLVSLRAARNEPANRKLHLKNLADIADEIMAGSRLFGYNLLQRFGRSLCNYLAELEEPEEQHMIVIQYHVEAMQAVMRQKLVGDGDAIGKALGDSLEKAIHKFGPKSHTGQAIKSAPVSPAK